MAEIIGRAVLENLLSKLIAKELRFELSELMKLLGDEPNMNNVPPSYWDNGGKRLRSVIEPVLRDIYMQQAKEQLDQSSIGIDWSIINQNAIDWSSQYSFDLVTGLTERSKQVVNTSLNKFFTNPTTIGELEKSLLGTFGPVRAEMIAITEVTRAAVEGEQKVVDEIIARNPGMESIDIWLTNRDEKTCLICGPRHGKERGTNWEENPPAHPRCRCWLRHDFRRKKDNG